MTPAGGRVSMNERPPAGNSSQPRVAPAQVISSGESCIEDGVIYHCGRVSRMFFGANVSIARSRKSCNRTWRKPSRTVATRRSATSVWLHNQGEGSESRRKARRLDRLAPCRPGLRMASVVEASNCERSVHLVARAGYRRGHRRLPSCRRGPSANTAGCPTGATVFLATTYVDREGRIDYRDDFDYPTYRPTATSSQIVRRHSSSEVSTTGKRSVSQKPGSSACIGGTCPATCFRPSD